METKKIVIRFLFRFLMEELNYENANNKIPYANSTSLSF